MYNGRTDGRTRHDADRPTDGRTRYGSARAAQLACTKACSPHDHRTAHRLPPTSRTARMHTGTLADGQTDGPTDTLRRPSRAACVHEKARSPQDHRTLHRHPPTMPRTYRPPPCNCCGGAPAHDVCDESTDGGYPHTRTSPASEGEASVQTHIHRTDKYY